MMENHGVCEASTLFDSRRDEFIVLSLAKAYALISDAFDMLIEGALDCNIFFSFCCSSM